MPHPNETPLEEWTDGWLVLEVASILNVPAYINMWNSEREKAKFPVTREEQIAFIKAKRDQQ